MYRTSVHLSGAKIFYLMGKYFWSQVQENKFQYNTSLMTMLSNFYKDTVKSLRKNPQIFLKLNFLCLINYVIVNLSKSV